MTPNIVFALLIGATLLWILLPFLPALFELLNPRDAAPLIAVGNDTGQLTYFASSFTELAVSEGLLAESLPAKLRDGTSVRTHSATSPLAAQRTAVTDMLVLVDDSRLPDGLHLTTECLARTAFHGGANSNYRAVLGLGSVSLGPGTTVQRWVHASGTLVAETGTRLIGRATSDEQIDLESEVQFDRLDAPCVRVGRMDTTDIPVLPASAYAPFAPQDALQLGPGYWRVSGDLTIPAGTSVPGSLIVLGNLIVAEGALVEGAVKARGTLQVRRGALLKGAIAARGVITIDDGARLLGPVISESEIVLGASIVGNAGRRTTITAPRVVLRHGATVYGAVMTARGGVSMPT